MVYYGTTDIGKRRAANQDTFTVKDYPGGHTVAVVCDGMGGANGGATASSVAAETFVEYLDRFFDDPEAKNYPREIDGEGNGPEIPDVLADAVFAANEAVFTMSQNDPELAGMGTTLVAVLTTEQNVYAVNVGDSRMYLIGSEGIRQVTRDHSYIQHLIDLGRLSPRKARTARNKNIITRAVGTEETVKADLYRVDRRPLPDDPGPVWVLLCSDGLSNMAEPEEIAQIVTGSGEPSKESLREAAEKLVELANDRGGVDNITAVILAC